MAKEQNTVYCYRCNEPLKENEALRAWNCEGDFDDCFYFHPECFAEGNYIAAGVCPPEKRKEREL